MFNHLQTTQCFHLNLIKHPLSPTQVNQKLPNGHKLVTTVCAYVFAGDAVCIYMCRFSLGGVSQCACNHVKSPEALT